MTQTVENRTLGHSSMLDVDRGPSWDDWWAYRRRRLKYHGWQPGDAWAFALDRPRQPRLPFDQATELLDWLENQGASSTQLAHRAAGLFTRIVWGEARADRRAG